MAFARLQDETIGFLYTLFHGNAPAPAAGQGRKAGACTLTQIGHEGQESTALSKGSGFGRTLGGASLTQWSESPPAAPATQGPGGEGGWTPRGTPGLRSWFYLIACFLNMGAEDLLCF